MTWGRLVLANLGRAKLRTGLTGAAIAAAMMLVALLLTMPAGLDAIIDEASSNTRISVHHKGGIVYMLPASFTRKVRQVPGVAAAMAMTWFGGAVEESGQVTFPNFAVEPDHVGAVYPDYPISAQALADFRRYRDGAIIGAKLARRYGWRVGDRVTLRSGAWSIDLDCRIVGLIESDDAPQFWFSQAYLDEALRATYGRGLGIAGLIWARVDDPRRVTEVMRHIDDLSRNSDAETASETERSFMQKFFSSLSGLATVITIVTGIVTCCIVFIAANTASMAIRERTAEIAGLKAVGFPRRVIFGALVAENLLLATVAGTVGMALAVSATGVLRAVAGWSEALGPLASFVVTPRVVGLSALITLAIGIVAGTVPALGAARKPVAEALREVV